MRILAVDAFLFFVSECHGFRPYLLFDARITVLQFGLSASACFAPALASFSFSIEKDSPYRASTGFGYARDEDGT